ncbi:MAG: fimbrillin family protein [Prevotella sp.]|nr:fimbrillin family protein [Prevotella sp.]
MKKNLWIFAAAAVALAACSNDDTISENIGFDDASAISFRAFTNNMTRAAAAHFDEPNDNFKVTAFAQGTTSTAYFANVTFTTTDGTTFTSPTKYYWPSGNNLDFYAWAPASLSNAYNSIPVTVADAAADQIDFVYAATKDWGKATLQEGTAATHSISTTVPGVTLNFRHAESKIIIQLKNSNSNVAVTANNVTLKNVYGAGTFVFADANTDGKDNALLTGGWTPSGDADAVYSQDITAATFTSATAVGTDMKLIPQVLTAGDTYTAETPGNPAVDDEFTAPCITVALKIQNSGDNAYILGAASGENEYVTAMFPLPTTTWVPGKQYTYVVDLAGGGYYPANHDTDAALDPILEGAEIKFVSVTVDDWSPYDADGTEEGVQDIDVAM